MVKTSQKILDGTVGFTSYALQPHRSADGVHAREITKGETELGMEKCFIRRGEK